MKRGVEMRDEKCVLEARSERIEREISLKFQHHNNSSVLQVLFEFGSALFKVVKVMCDHLLQ